MYHDTSTALSEMQILYKVSVYNVGNWLCGIRVMYERIGRQKNTRKLKKLIFCQLRKKTFFSFKLRYIMILRSCGVLNYAVVTNYK